jgi:hypothetical protein
MTRPADLAAETWYDDATGRFVRPYVLTGGRVPVDPDDIDAAALAAATSPIGGLDRPPEGVLEKVLAGLRAL